jgi:hypothetical protein
MRLDDQRGEVSDRRFLLLAWAALVTFIATAALATALNSAAILFSTLLCAIGVYAGFLCTIYVSRRSADAGSARYASAGHRLSLEIYDALQDVLTILAKGQRLREVAEIRNHIEIVREKLKTLQGFSLSSNQQWEEMLPPERTRETKKREKETRLPLQGGRALVIKEEEVQTPNMDL